MNSRPVHLYGFHWSFMHTFASTWFYLLKQTTPRFYPKFQGAIEIEGPYPSSQQPYGRTAGPVLICLLSSYWKHMKNFWEIGRQHLSQPFVTHYLVAHVVYRLHWTYLKFFHSVVLKQAKSKTHCLGLSCVCLFFPNHYPLSNQVFSLVWADGSLLTFLSLDSSALLPLEIFPFTPFLWIGGTFLLDTVSFLCDLS